MAQLELTTLARFDGAASYNAAERLAGPLRDGANDVRVEMEDGGTGWVVLTDAETAARAARLTAAEARLASHTHAGSIDGDAIRTHAAARRVYAEGRPEDAEAQRLCHLFTSVVAYMASADALTGPRDFVAADAAHDRARTAMTNAGLGLDYGLHVDYLHPSTARLACLLDSATAATSPATAEMCALCSGDGSLTDYPADPQDAETVTCPECDGTGTVEREQDDETSIGRASARPGVRVWQQECPTCSYLATPPTVTVPAETWDALTQAATDLLRSLNSAPTSYEDACAESGTTEAAMDVLAAALATAAPALP